MDERGCDECSQRERDYGQRRRSDWQEPLRAHRERSSCVRASRRESSHQERVLLIYCWPCGVPPSTSSSAHSQPCAAQLTSPGVCERPVSSWRHQRDGRACAHLRIPTHPIPLRLHSGCSKEYLPCGHRGTEVLPSNHRGKRRLHAAV